MTPIEARKIARHHLGDRLHWIATSQGSGWIKLPGTPTDEWCGDEYAWVIGVTDSAIQGRGKTLDAAAADCAAQLRAGGWVPTHARLEWHSRKWQHHLRLHMDNYTADVMFAAESQGGLWSVFNRTLTTDDDRILSRATRETAAAVIAAWHAAALPSLHLPPFPGDKP